MSETTPPTAYKEQTPQGKGDGVREVRQKFSSHLRMEEAKEAVSGRGKLESPILDCGFDGEESMCSLHRAWS